MDLITRDTWRVRGELKGIFGFLSLLTRTKTPHTKRKTRRKMRSSIRFPERKYWCSCLVNNRDHRTQMTCY